MCAATQFGQTGRLSSHKQMYQLMKFGVHRLKQENERLIRGEGNTIRN